MTTLEQEQIATRAAELTVERLIALGAVTPRPPAVLTLAEAVSMTKRGSVRAFRRWNKQYGPCECGHGRFSRERIERGLAKEARK